MAVDSGSSTGRAASPKAPPTAPEAAAASVWARPDGFAVPLAIDGSQRELQSRAERGFAHAGNRMAGGRRGVPAQHADRTTEGVGEALREARPLEARDRALQIFGFLARQPRGHDLDHRHCALARATDLVRPRRAQYRAARPPAKTRRAPIR